MTTRDDSPRALIRYALVGAVLTGAAAWTLYLIRDVVVLVYISALVAIGLGPLVNAIERRPWPNFRRRMPRWAAILAIYLVLIGALVGVGSLVIPPLVRQSRDLWSNLPDLLHKTQQWLIDRGLLNHELSVSEAVQQTQVGSSDAVGAVITAVTGFIGGIFGFVTILVLGFYLMVDGDSIVQTFVRLFPRPERPRVEHACRYISTKVSAWLRGQLLLALVIGAFSALGLFLMGVPYFYVLALLAAFGELIPVVGPILSAIPAVAVALTVSPTVALSVLAYVFVLQQLENHLLVPKIMQQQVGVSAVVVIVALLAGGSLLGIVGAILAVPTAAILQVIFMELVPEASDE